MIIKNVSGYLVLAIKLTFKLVTHMLMNDFTAPWSPA